MSILFYFIAPFIAATIMHTIMYARSKNTEKVNRGFVFNHYKLTYRRRMIRSLWNIPIFILIYLGIYWITDLNSTEYIILGMMFILLGLLDFLYNFVKWQKHEKETSFSERGE